MFEALRRRVGYQASDNAPLILDCPAAILGNCDDLYVGVLLQQVGVQSWVNPGRRKVDYYHSSLSATRFQQGIEGVSGHARSILMRDITQPGLSAKFTTKR